MKRLIVTRSDKRIGDITNITHPIINNYAQKCNADFEVISKDPPVNTADKHPHWRIAYIYDYYNEYDRILCLDSDIIINKNCPDLFELVPENKIATVFEDKGTRKRARRKCIENIQRKHGDIGWEEGYINTGVFLTSKMHRDIFLPINGKWYTDWGSDDVHIGYQIRKLGFEIYELSYKWNHMTMFSEPWNNNANRLDSYIIHYAGKGQFDKRISRIDNINRDVKEIYG